MIKVEKIKLIWQYDDNVRNKINVYCWLETRILVMIILSSEEAQNGKKV